MRIWRALKKNIIRAPIGELAVNIVLGCVCKSLSSPAKSSAHGGGRGGGACLTSCVMTCQCCIYSVKWRHLTQKKYRRLGVKRRSVCKRLKALSASGYLFMLWANKPLSRRVNERHRSEEEQMVIRYRYIPAHAHISASACFFARKIHSALKVGTAYGVSREAEIQKLGVRCSAPVVEGGGDDRPS